MLQRFGLLALCFGSVAAASGCAEETEPPVYSTGTKSQAIHEGETDTENTNVVGLANNGNGQGVGGCTGSLIAPNLVLTAQHCIADLPVVDERYPEAVVCGQSLFLPAYEPDAVGVTTEGFMWSERRWNYAKEIRVPEGGKDACGFDVALVILRDNIDDEVPLVPRIDVPVQTGERYTAVGYGLKDERQPYSSGTRRIRTGDLEVVCGTGQCSGGFGYGAAFSEWQGNKGICSGDSGGPALDADGKVIGVVSRGAQGCTQPVYGSVTSHGEWIREVALEAAELGGYDAPFWATTGSSTPPPGWEPPVVDEEEPEEEPGDEVGEEVPIEDTPAEGGGDPGPGDAGEACSAESLCQSGLVCAFQTTVEDAVCAEACELDRQCGEGFSCDKGVGACFPTAAAEGEDSESGGGCSVAVGTAAVKDPAKPVPWSLLGGLGAVGLLLRRRRRV